MTSVDMTLTFVEFDRRPIQYLHIHIIFYNYLVFVIYLCDYNEFLV